MAVKTPTNDTREGAAPRLRERLRTVHVALRNDLEVSRHLFRGEPAYLVRDPLTLQSHRLEPADYKIFIAVRGDRPLGETFNELVGRGDLDRDDEESFYQFIVSLHRLTFLNLPVADNQLLYKRHVAKKTARRRQKLLSILFLRVPLINPDDFLDRTLHHVRFLFSRPFFSIWAALVVAALFVGVLHFGALVQPVQGVLAARNLILMWITLIGLKVLHEFGHAYACKHYGGYVPEMGAYFILFTPCAYVDATASWGFTRKRERLIVCLAGMYVESFFAAIAMFVWAATPPGLIHDIAYNVIFLAGVVTFLFNINPLMRYDGYYVLTDLVEIPNLRQRSTVYVVDLLKRFALGIRTSPKTVPTRERILLSVFGVCAALYRITLTLGIAALIASKMFILGMMVAAGFAISAFYGPGRRLMLYLWRSPETAPVRVRAVEVSALLLIGLPVAVAMIPIRGSVDAAGAIGCENETVVRARVEGFVDRTWIATGQQVDAGDRLVRLRNDAYHEAVAHAVARVEASALRQNAYEVDAPAQALAEAAQQAAFRRDLNRRQAELAALSIRADAPGRVIACIQSDDTGRYLELGEPIATLVAGRWQVRCVLTEDEMADCRPAEDDAVEVRLTAAPGRSRRGTIRRIAPAGSRTVAAQTLTHLGGGDIAVDPESREASQPYFEITIDLPLELDRDLRHGMTCKVRFDGHADSIAAAVMRRLIRFTDSLMQRS
jgi:putative peptide zinc metalloprotease protein